MTISAKNKKKSAVAESSDDEDDSKSVVSNVSSNAAQPAKVKSKKGIFFMFLLVDYIKHVSVLKKIKSVKYN